MNRVVPTLVMLNCLWGCGDPADVPSDPGDEADEVFRVLAINAPLAEFAARIGGEHVDVSVLPPGGIDPVLWKPDASDVLAMQEADLVILNGAGYEPWLARVSLTQRRLLDTSAKIEEELIRAETVTHQHGPEGQHSHGASAFTLWLDPLLALDQAAAIRGALSAALPEHEAEFLSGFGALKIDLFELHDEWQAIAVELAGAPLLFSHPVYQYFERRYHLNGRSLHWEPNEIPETAQWSALIELLKVHPAGVMIWEGEPLATVRERLATLGIRVAVIEPGASAESSPGYLAGQRTAVQSVRRALSVEH